MDSTISVAKERHVREGQSRARRGAFPGRPESETRDASFVFVAMWQEK